MFKNSVAAIPNFQAVEGTWKLVWHAPVHNKENKFFGKPAYEASGILNPANHKPFLQLVIKQESLRGGFFGKEIGERKISRFENIDASGAEDESEVIQMKFSDESSDSDPSETWLDLAISMKDSDGKKNDINLSCHILTPDESSFKRLLCRIDRMTIPGESCSFETLGYLGFIQDTVPPVIKNSKVWISASAIKDLSTGDELKELKDLSSNGLRVTTLSEGSAPKFSSSGLNGHPTIQFNGSDQCLEISSPESLKLQSLTVFAVFNQDESNAKEPVGPLSFDGSDSQAMGRGFRIHLGSFTKGSGDGSWEGVGAKTALESLPFHIVSGSYAEGSGVMRFSRDGIENSGAIDTAGISYKNATRFTIGCNYNGANPRMFFKGDISEIVIFDRALSASDEDYKQILNYLKNKYR
jgi:hypothetical protein